MLLNFNISYKPGKSGRYSLDPEKTVKLLLKYFNQMFDIIGIHGKRSPVCSLRLMFSAKYPKSEQIQKMWSRLTKIS